MPAPSKRTKQNLKAKERNKALKSKLSTELKKFETNLKEKPENKEESLKTVSKTLDKMVTKGIIHKNKAARKKSRLAKKVNSL